MKTFLITILFALPVFAVFAQADGDYDQLIVEAGNSLKAGQLDEAKQDVQQAIRLNTTNYMAYVIAAKIAAKQNDTEGANNFAQKALELAPDEDKDKLRQFANELQSAAPTPTASIEPQSTTSAPLSDDDQLKHDGLMRILEDAAKSDSDEDRKDSYRQFLTRSVDFADAHPNQLDIWVGRAYAAMQLDYPDTGWLAGKRLKALGAVHSDDSKVHDEMVELESKGWLDAPQPLLTGGKWTKWTLGQLQSAANQGDADAQFNLGNMYQNGQSGLSQDYAQSINWYQKSADQGYAVAQENLGYEYENGLGVDRDNAQAVAWYRKAAEQGEPSAQNNLALDYENGLGVTQDYAQALIWYQKAALQGQAEAEYGLGWMYQHGMGITQNYVKALDWYQKSAAQNLAGAELLLGLTYANGWGVTRDYPQAFNWFQKSAGQGNASAEQALGQMYEKGLGVTQDYAQALSWYQKSAVQGNDGSQCSLGRMYENGRGADRDIAEAKNWYQKAAAQGNSYASNRLAVLNNNSQ